MLPEDIDVVADVIVDAVRREVAPVAAKLADLEQRAPVAGRDGTDGTPGVPGEKGADGAHGQDGANGVDGIHGKDGEPGAKGDTGADGPQGDKGLEGAPGRDGRDGQPGVPGPPGEKGLDGVNGRDGIDGTHGVDGLGFEDLMVEHDGERGFTFCFTKGDVVKRFPFEIPCVLYRGVFEQGRTYAKGDSVTFGGSQWIARDATAEKPGIGATPWQLAVKAGRDGREGKQGTIGQQGVKGERGNDGRNFS